MAGGVPAADPARGIGGIDGMAVTAQRAGSHEDELLSAYIGQRAPGYNELVDDQGRVRPHWQSFISALATMSPGERSLRADKLKHRVRETGIAYDIFADPRRASQRWTVDLVPLIFSATEWSWLERALVQRARLYDSILADLYGPQILMQSGKIPPALVFSDPSFLRPCHGIKPVDGFLHFYAADIARGTDGAWRVIDNHTETPAGAGFALANRVVHTHVAGDLFKASNGVRIASFFQKLQSGLAARSGRGDPRIAILTSGPHHEDYFSHAYLARYLGYLLVEGGDLRTQGERVYLKTLEGLKDIDIIVRCIEGRAADPLELDPDRFEGPAGLLRASRRTPGLVVNAIGSAVVQNRALGMHLARLSQELLGETLMMPDTPRLWLGDHTQRQTVLSRLGTLLIRRCQEGTGRPGRAEQGDDLRSLSLSDHDRLLHEIELNGAAYVAEEKAPFATTPAWTARGLEARSFAVRLYVARTAEGFAVMPGGLAMTIDPDVAGTLTAPEGQTRDVWVMSDTEVAPHISLWRPTLETARVQRSQRVIQSRVADDLFWLGRYAERADWIMRVLRSAMLRLQEDSGPANVQFAARTCLEVLLANDRKLELPAAAVPDALAIEELAAQLISARLGNRTLERTLDGLHRVASLTRDRLSLEAWHTLNVFRAGDEWRTAMASARPGTTLDMLETGLAAISAFNGLMHENMTRNFGWLFCDMGRRIERGFNLCEAVRVLFATTPAREDETASLFFLLEVADSFITYRSRYRLDPLLPLVLDLLLLDETNPRSLAFQLAAIARHLEALPQSKSGTNLPEERRLILAALTATRLADVERLASAADRSGLDVRLREQLEWLPSISNAIARRYFSLSDDQPQRVHTRLEPRR